ncbi:MAG: hypothetical protein FWG89_03030 [Treponema sp.]|nr:hypothetical protein [Treponema sp.]
MKKVIIIGAAIALLAGGMVLFFQSQPRFVWIAEDRFAEALEAAIADSPFEGTQIIPLSALPARMPRTWYGYRIGSDVLPSDDDESIVTTYRRLTEQRQYGEALLLALDPWMVFRKFTSLPLSREQADNGPAEAGLMLLAGSDDEAVAAWSAQFLQESPGVFSRDIVIWEHTRERLFRGGQFQQGARTFSWQEIWPRLLDDDEIAWVYAPLSRNRQLPLFETSRLEADVFPSRPGWNEFGIQAELLWAVPFGNDKNREKTKETEEWLTDASTQGTIADSLGWIAAHPGAPPFNPVSSQVRIAWLTSSYVWTLPRHSVFQ